MASPEFATTAATRSGQSVAWFRRESGLEAEQETVAWKEVQRKGCSAALSCAPVLLSRHVSSRLDDLPPPPATRESLAPAFAPLAHPFLLSSP